MTDESPVQPRNQGESSETEERFLDNLPIIATISTLGGMFIIAGDQFGWVRVVLWSFIALIGATALVLLGLRIVFPGLLTLYFSQVTAQTDDEEAVQQMGRPKLNHLPTAVNEDEYELMRFTETTTANEVMPPPPGEGKRLLDIILWPRSILIELVSEPLDDATDQTEDMLWWWTAVLTPTIFFIGWCSEGSKINLVTVILSYGVMGIVLRNWLMLRRTDFYWP